MSKLIVVIGLPGSGKTHYLEGLKTKKEIKNYYDDYHNRGYGKDNQLGKYALQPFLSCNFGLLLAQLIEGDSVGVTDVVYTQEKLLDEFLQSIFTVLPETLVELHYFENDSEATTKNVKVRRRAADRIEKELRYIKEVSPTYVIPKIKRVPVYKKK